MFSRLSLVLLLSGLSLAPEAASQSLRGSRGSVDKMYRQARSHELHFYETGSGVRKAATAGTFVRLSDRSEYRLAAVSHPYALPTTETFLRRLGSQYQAACGERMVVTSAVRPTSLRLANGAAKSVHPTGMSVDLRKPAAGRCLTWLRKTLSSLESQGVIEATEEHRPPHFHVAVFPRQYAGYVKGAPVKLAANALVAEEVERPSTRKKSEKTTRMAKAETEAEARRYKVRRGDSLWTIARKTSVSVDRLKSANSLRSTRIVAGQVLLIPAGE